jgi:hypothetical protein
MNPSMDITRKAEDPRPGIEEAFSRQDKQPRVGRANRIDGDDNGSSPADFEQTELIAWFMSVMQTKDFVVGSQGDCLAYGVKVAHGSFEFQLHTVVVGRRWIVKCPNNPSSYVLIKF